MLEVSKQMAPAEIEIEIQVELKTEADGRAILGRRELRSGANRVTAFLQKTYS
jgi:hypothetical protein